MGRGRGEGIGGRERAVTGIRERNRSMGIRQKDKDRLDMLLVSFFFSFSDISLVFSLYVCLSSVLSILSDSSRDLSFCLPS